MCSKYSRKNKKTKVGKKEVSIPADPQPAIRPTDRASIIRAGSSDLEVAELRWGLIPSWAKDPKIGIQCINARSETVAEKPAFRESFPWAIRGVPAVPQAGHAKGFVVRSLKSPRNFAAAPGFPFKKGVGRDEAAALDERVTKSRLFRNGFGAGVDL